MHRPQVPGPQHDHAGIEACETIAQGLRYVGADWPGETEGCRMNRAESGGADVLAPMRGDGGLPGDEASHILAADLVRRQRENKKQRPKGAENKPFGLAFHFISHAHATLRHDATNTVAADARWRQCDGFPYC